MSKRGVRLIEATRDAAAITRLRERVEDRDREIERLRRELRLADEKIETLEAKLENAFVEAWPHKI